MITKINCKTPEFKKSESRKSFGLEFCHNSLTTYVDRIFPITIHFYILGLPSMYLFGSFYVLDT